MPIVATSTVVVGGDALWLVASDQARRFDPSSGSVVASLPLEHAPGRYAEGAFWRFGTNPDRRCESVPADWVSYSPYRVERIDPVTNAVVFGVDLPGTCRYAADNRSPYAEFAVGPSAAWVRDPESCQLFEIDARRGVVVSVSEQSGRLVAADAGGPWFLANATPNEAASSSCAVPLAPPLALTRRAEPATTAPAWRLPDSYFPGGAFSSIALTDGAAWVANARADSTGPALARLDTSTGSLITTRISPGHVATGAGQVWFVGDFPAETDEARRPNPGLLGEIDPVTGTVKRTFQLDLGPGRGPMARIVDVSADSVWIDANLSPRELIQVAT
jgi:hypothetical protein